jgi:hypothetical protein
VLAEPKKNGQVVQGVPFPTAFDSYQCTHILSGTSAKKRRKRNVPQKESFSISNPIYIEKGKLQPV